MSTKEQLFARLKDPEDSLVERKASTSDRDEIREAVVAFANSVRSGTGVLFIGVNPDGTPSGAVQDADKAQRDIRKYLDKCYPPIATYQMYALELSGQPVVAVEVAESRDRPHFAGLCAVRVGSETIKTVAATAQRYRELIEERNDLVWYLRPRIGAGVTVVEQHNPTGGVVSWSNPNPAWTLEAITAFFVTLSSGGVRRSYSMRRLMVEHDHDRNQPLLRITLESVR